MQDLIRIETQNNRTVHFLVINNMTVDTNIFRTKLLLTDRTIISSFVVGRDINYWL
jgi:hypothetical protein